MGKLHSIPECHRRKQMGGVFFTKTQWAACLNQKDFQRTVTQSNYIPVTSTCSELQNFTSIEIV